MVKICVIFYSTYGHVFKMAEKIAEGARAAGAEVDLRRVKELLPDEVLEKMGGIEPRKEWEHIPVITAEEMTNYDGFAFGYSAKFGVQASSMKFFLESLGGLWYKNALLGKYGTVFSCTGSQHGGNEMSLFTGIIPLFHLGMVIVGVPPTFKGLSEGKEISGGSPYGMTTMTLNNTRFPSEIELDGAFAQGKHLVSMMTQKFT